LNIPPSPPLTRGGKTKQTGGETCQKEKMKMKKQFYLYYKSDWRNGGDQINQFDSLAQAQAAAMALKPANWPYSDACFFASSFVIIEIGV
jgi:hypothetical protein